MTNIILFGIFGSLLYVAISGALGYYLAARRGRQAWLGFIIGAGVPLVGLIYLGLRSFTRRATLDEAYAARLISEADYAKTKQDLALSELTPSSKRKSSK